MTLQQVYNIASSLQSLKRVELPTSKTGNLVEEDMIRTALPLKTFGYNFMQCVRVSSQLVAFVFLDMLMKESIEKHGRLVQLDATYKTNKHGWILFTLYVRDDCGSWLPGGHFLCKNEESIIIARCLQIVKGLCTEWRAQYFITDNDVSEKSAILLAFPDGVVETFDCTVHSLRTWNRRICQGDENALVCMRKAMYARSEEECKDYVTQAFNVAQKEETRRYIRDNYLNKSSRNWALWARQVPILLQITTTNPIESYHHIIKYFLKRNMKRRTISELCTLLDDIDKKRFATAEIKRRNFLACELVRYTVDYPQFGKSPIPIQMLLATEVDAAVETFRVVTQNGVQSAQQNGQQSHEQINDSIRYFHMEPGCSCLFTRKYLLPCRHMLFKDKMARNRVDTRYPVISDGEWNAYVNMFVGVGYNVY